jgi:hypothetical protein
MFQAAGRRSDKLIALTVRDPITVAVNEWHRMFWIISRNIA